MDRREIVVIPSLVFDDVAGTSCLFVLDATTLNEIGRATLPQPVTFGFHGALLEERGSWQ
jgi:carotenoid cleavage dioxygenase-like enzyme